MPPTSSLSATAPPPIGQAGLRRRLALLPALLLAPGTALALTLASLVPAGEGALLARFADDQAALAAALATDAPLIALPGEGRVALGPAPGLAAQLRAAGALSVTRLPAALPCAAPGRSA